MEEIRLLKENEAEEAIRLSEYAFQYQLSAEDRSEQIAKEMDNALWGGFVNGRLAARLAILPLHTYINGTVMKMGGIGGVATWPEYRRSGLVKRLLTRTLASMKEDGQVLSFLAPFSFPFYRKYGWETYVDHKKYIVHTNQLPKISERDGDIIRLNNPLEQWETLDRIYEPHARTYNGMLKRDARWWERVLKNGERNAAVFQQNNGEQSGYILYTVKNRELTVHELVCLNTTARIGLWHFIGNHDSMIDRVTLTVPSNDPLPFLLPDPRIKQEIIPYFMGRIVDVEAFLTQYAFAQSEAPQSSAERIQLRIFDPLAPWNDADFELTVIGGHATVRKLVRLESRTVPNYCETAVWKSGQEGLEPGTVVCDIQTLSAMLIGYQRPRQLREIGRLAGDEASLKLLEKILPQGQTFLNDFF